MQETQELITELIKCAEKNNKKNLRDNRNLKAKNNNKLFEKFKIKDIVFLAVITACTLVTSAIMPLLVNVPLFCIIELGLGVQFSLFSTIGIMKVRKLGSLTFMALCISIFLVFMFPPMVLLVLCALVCEILTAIIYRGYKSDVACVFSGTLYMPLTIPFLYVYYNLFYTVSGTEKAAVSMFIGGTNMWAILGLSLAVIVECLLSALLGRFIVKELKKAGKLK